MAASTQCRVGLATAPRLSEATRRLANTRTARQTAHEVHARSPAEPVHHRALGSREGGRFRRSTNLQGVRSGWSRDARDGPRASIRLVPVPWDRMLARASAPNMVTQSLPFILA